MALQHKQKIGVMGEEQPKGIAHDVMKHVWLSYTEHMVELENNV